MSGRTDGRRRRTAAAAAAAAAAERKGEGGGARAAAQAAAAPREQGRAPRPTAGVGVRVRPLLSPPLSGHEPSPPPSEGLRSFFLPNAAAAASRSRPWLGAQDAVGRSVAARASQRHRRRGPPGGGGDRDSVARSSPPAFAYAFWRTTLALARSLARTLPTHSAASTPLSSSPSSSLVQAAPPSRSHSFPRKILMRYSGGGGGGCGRGAA